MYKIEKITTQKKNQERYNIFLNDGKKSFYAFSVYEATLIRFLLKKGMSLDDEKIDEIIHYETIQWAYTLSIRYLSFRVRSEKEIYDYLKKKEIEEIYIAETISRLKKEKLIDDLEFAKMFTRTRINTTLKGPRQVRMELKQKGVNDVHINQALDYFTFEIEYERAMKLGEKRVRQRRNDSVFEKRNQVYQTLQVQGFRSEVISSVIEQLLDANEELANEKEREAIDYQLERIYRRQSRKYKGFLLIQKIKEGLYRRGFQGDLIEKAIQQHEYTKEILNQ